VEERRLRTGPQSWDMWGLRGTSEEALA